MNAADQLLNQTLSEIASQYDRFVRNTADLATFYLAASASAKFFATAQLPHDDALELRMSNDFPLTATTIRGATDVVALYQSGEYQRLNAYQAVVSLCSLFEVFISGVGRSLSVRPRDAFSIVSFRRKDRPVEIRNQTLCMVRSIHERHTFDSQLNGDNALCWIFNFFLLRNTIVHEGGILNEGIRRRLVGRWADHPLGPLEINGNHIDDMVHFLRDNARAFLCQARIKCGLL